MSRDQLKSQIQILYFFLTEVTVSRPIFAKIGLTSAKRLNIIDPRNLALAKKIIS
jgi:hypothetical protein